MPTVLAGRSAWLTDLRVDLARSPAERQRALELHRDVYRRKGLLPAGAKAEARPQACASGSALFVAKEGEWIVGTIAFYMDSDLGLPMEDVHGDEVEAMRHRFARVAEVGGLAVNEGSRGLGITMALYEATFRWARARAEGLVACVNPSSRRVYGRLLFFEPLGECRPHPRFGGAPSIPIGLDLESAIRRYREAHPNGSDGDGPSFFQETPPPYLADLDAAPRAQWSDEDAGTTCC